MIFRYPLEYTLWSEILIALILQHIFFYTLFIIIVSKHTNILYFFLFSKLNSIFVLCIFLNIHFSIYIFYHRFLNLPFFLFLFFSCLFLYHRYIWFHISKNKLRKAILAFRFDSFVDDRFQREIRSGRESQVTRRLTNLFISITQL